MHKNKRYNPDTRMYNDKRYGPDTRMYNDKRYDPDTRMYNDKRYGPDTRMYNDKRYDPDTRMYNTTSIMTLIEGVLVRITRVTTLIVCQPHSSVRTPHRGVIGQLGVHQGQCVLPALVHQLER